MSGIYDTMCSYVSIYQATAVRAWDHMTPQQYASILIMVGVIGWYAMKGGAK